MPRYSPIRWCGLLPLALSACMMRPQPGGTNVDFQPPLFSPHWVAEPYPASGDGRPGCAVTAGHNAIRVVLMRDASHAIVHQVSSERTMAPGAELTLRVNQHVYRTGGGMFPAGQTEAIVQDLRAGDVAYVEWNEPEMRGNNSRNPPFSNTLRLDEFNARYAECKSRL
ncbi:MAG: hypothetical protein JO089_02375 [Alphaproteobacteria bacterium]|nr:hypothetical protein [Alphaproteobacteria bacterium]